MSFCFFIGEAALFLKSEIKFDELKEFKKFISDVKKIDLRLEIKRSETTARLRMKPDSNEVINKVSIIPSSEKLIVISKLFQGQIKNNFDCVFYANNDSGLIVRNIIRVCFAVYMAKNEGMTLHSSGFLYNGKSYIFTGIPDSGKSTVARFASEQGLEIISDEFIIFRKKNKKYYCYPTPFGGDLPSGIKHGVLKNIYIIEKSNEFCVWKASFEDALMNIMNGELLLMTTHLSDLMIHEKILKNSADICRNMQIFNLKFPYESTFIREILK